ncbi:MAG: hypothetical protein IT197_00970 [Acidimicrobiia bacterium]|nr:hypothetical protein [Acidimicrobiia bacterium]
MEGTAQPEPPPGILRAGVTTGIGSLPHTDPAAAAALSLELTPGLPFAPQLPRRTPWEGMVAQWAGALPEVEVCPDGSVRVDPAAPAGDPVPRFDPERHGGLLAFLDAAGRAPGPPDRVKLQVVGPLTLAMALVRAGMPVAAAFNRSTLAVRAWVTALEDLVERALPGAGRLLLLDEPGLVAFAADDAPIDNDAAVDHLSHALAAVTGEAGVHICGDGDVRIAFEAGPSVLAVSATPHLVGYASSLARHLDAGGWVLWGVIPTDGPIGETSESHWRTLSGVWCELTRRGCEPGALRRQALVSPACGLAGHGESQAVRALRLAAEVADRVGDQALAARLTLGA